MSALLLGRRDAVARWRQCFTLASPPPAERRVVEAWRTVSRFLKNILSASHMRHVQFNKVFTRSFHVFHDYPEKSFAGIELKSRM